MNPCYWSPEFNEVQPHGVDYGPDRYMDSTPQSTASEPLHTNFGLEALVPKEESKGKADEQCQQPEDINKRPPKPPYASHGHTMWHTFSLKNVIYVGYVKRNEKNQPTHLRHGYGKYTYNKSSREYKGQWWNDQKHGRGNEQRHDGMACFIGEFRKGLKHGRGIVKYKDGNIDKGIWKYDQKIKTIMRGNTHVAFDT